MPHILLLVEDDPALAQWIQDALQATFDCQVQIAPDPLVALRCLQTSQIEGLLIEHCLPHLSGRAFYRALYNSRRPMLPTLFLTPTPDQLPAELSSAVLVLAKPFTLAALVAAVSTVVPALGGPK